MERHEEDRSSVYNISDCLGYQNTSPIDPSLTGDLFMCIFLASYLIVLLLTSLCIRGAFRRIQQQGKQTKLLYRASAVVLTFFNILTVILDFYLTAKYYSDNSMAFVAVFMVLPGKVLLAILIELPVVCVGVCTCELDRNDRRCYRVFHALAIWQIIFFVHRLIIDIVISVVFFIISPAQTLGVVTLLLYVIVSVILFVAIIINKGCAGSLLSFPFIICVALTGLVITGTLITITLVFIIFVDNGLKSAGTGGFILSIIPSLMGGVFGYCINKHNVISAVLGEQPDNGDSRNQQAGTERQPLLAPPPRGHPPPGGRHA